MRGGKVQDQDHPPRRVACILGDSNGVPSTYSTSTNMGKKDAMSWHAREGPASQGRVTVPLQ